MDHIKITISGTGQKTQLAQFVLGHLRSAGFQSSLTDKNPDHDLTKQWGKTVYNTIVAVETQSDVQGKEDEKLLNDLVFVLGKYVDGSVDTGALSTLERLLKERDALTQKVANGSVPNVPQP